MEKTMKKSEIAKMYAEILLMKKMLSSLKEDFEDRFLTAEEELNLEKAREEYRKGETISLEDLKKKLNV